MKVYCGAVGGEKALSYIWEHNYGLMFNPLSWSYSQNSICDWRYWALDNGAYKAYTDNTEFDEERFLKTIHEKVPKSEMPPDFIVVPDKVGAGLESLQFSLDWRSKLKSLTQHKWYLAVQDNMEVVDVEPILDKFDGIFVGGTVKWKIKTGGNWVKLAHKHNLPCHIGRIGTYRRIVWALRINADSIDSSTFFRKPNAHIRLESAKTQTLLEA
jgi:hypothetical protein